MIKTTKKNLAKLQDQYFTMFVIKEDGSRGLMYGGLNGIRFVHELIRYTSYGNRVVVVESDKAYEIMKEIYGSISNNSQRDVKFYDKIKDYGINGLDGLIF